MTFEVELKYHLAPGPQDALLARLAALGVTLDEGASQADLYFQHPARDFRATDEALRVRRCGRTAVLTYKGPKVDATTKTRVEIEAPLEGVDAAERLRQILVALGFQPAIEVRKLRRAGSMSWQGREVEVALDEVEGLGLFMELETLAEETELPLARACLTNLAAELGLTQSERRGYADMLAEAQAAQTE